MARRLGLGQYCGRSVRRRQVHGFVVTENRFQPGLRIGRHSHTHPHFTFVMSGGFTERYDGQTLDCGPSSILLVPADAPHTDEMSEAGAHTLGVEVSARVARRLADGPGLLQEAKVVSHDSLRLASQRLYSELRSDDIAADLAIESLALEILVLSSRLETPVEHHEPHWMKGVRDRLQAEFAAGLSLQDLAEEAGVHAAHLARSFRKVHGCTVGDYVRRLRLDHAERQVRNSHRPISEIAAEAGFCDQAHFCRSFRSAYGTSPSQYRASS